MSYEYTKSIVDTYNKKWGNVTQAMMNSNFIPNRKDPSYSLDGKGELILKFTFKMKVAFLEEIEFLLAFVSSKQSTEALVLDLEEQGYISSSISRDLGKFWVLTPLALYYFYTDTSKAFKDMNIPSQSLPTNSKLMLYKVQNAFIVSDVFDEMVGKLYSYYKSSLSKEAKQLYQKQIYIQQFIMSEKEKKMAPLAKEQYYKTYLEEHDLSKETNESYARYINHFKNEATTIHFFNLLKDFLSSKEGTPFREKALSLTRELLDAQFTNIYCDTKTSFRKRLYDNTSGNNHLAKEYKLYLIEELLKQFNIAKRNNNNTKLENKSHEEVILLQKRLKELDDVIAQYEKQKAILSSEFEAILYDKISDNDLPIFKEQCLTLESLRTGYIYITNVEKQEESKPLVTFTIFQPSFDELSVAFLFSKCERIFQFCLHNLVLCDYQIQVCVYSAPHKTLVENKIKTLKEQFESISHYSLLLPIVDQMKVLSVERHFKERYEVFREIKKKM